MENANMPAVDSAPVASAPEPATTPVQEVAPQSSGTEITVDDFKSQGTFLRDFLKAQPEQQADPDTAALISGSQPAATPPQEAAAQPPVEQPADPAQADKPPEQVSDELKVPIKLGESETEVTLAELKKGYMLNADYTRKTQSLAQERRAFEQEKQAWGSFGEEAKNALELSRAIARDPIGMIEYMREYYNDKGFHDPVDPEVLQREMEIERLQEQNATHEKKAQDLEMQAALAAYEEYMGHLQSKYGDEFNRADVEAYGLKHNIPIPEEAFKAMKADRFAEKATTYEGELTQLRQRVKEMEEKIGSVGKEAVQTYVQQKVESAANFTPPVGGGPAGEPPVKPSMPKTFEDAFKAAMAADWNK